MRRDNPSLVIRDAGLRTWREWLGMKPDLTKVTVTAGGSLDAGARFFTEGPGAEKIVVTVPAVRRGLEERLPSGVRVVALEEITAGGILDALEGFGVRSLMVEGGARTIGMFLDAGVVDSLRLAVSPATVGDTRAPRFPEFGRLPFEGRAEGGRYGGVRIRFPSGLGRVDADRPAPVAACGGVGRTQRTVRYGLSGRVRGGRARRPGVRGLYS